MGLAVMNLCARGRLGVYGEDDGFKERGMKGEGSVKEGDGRVKEGDGRADMKSPKHLTEKARERREGEPGLLRMRHMQND